MLAWIVAAIFMVAVIVVVIWLIREIKMDQLAEQDRQDWIDLTRPPVDRWPPHGDV